MPSAPCAHPTCSAYVPRRGEFCPAHARTEQRATEQRAARHRYYDQHKRNREAKSFYNSRAWRIARALKLASEPICERCQMVFATTVHHRKALEDCTLAERTCQQLLQSLCADCHSETEQEIRRVRPNAQEPGRD